MGNYSSLTPQMVMLDTRPKDHEPGAPGNWDDARIYRTSALYLGSDLHDRFIREKVSAAIGILDGILSKIKIGFQVFSFTPAIATAREDAASGSSSGHCSSALSFPFPKTCLRMELG